MAVANGVDGGDDGGEALELLSTDVGRLVEGAESSETKTVAGGEEGRRLTASSGSS